MQTRSPNLTIINFQDSLYRVDPVNRDIYAVCAYLYYGTNELTMDHLGNNVYATFNDVKNSQAYEMHLREVVAPMIKEGLATTKYKFEDVEYLNMEPYPHLIFAHREKKALTEFDKREIKKQLETILQKHNAKNTPLNKIKQDTFSKFFKHADKANSEIKKKVNQYRYR